MSNLSARSFRATLLLVLVAIMTLGACSTAASAAEGDGQSSPPSTDGTQPGNGGGDPGDDDRPMPVDPDFPIGGPVDPQPGDPGDGAVHVDPDPTVRNAVPHAIDHISVAADGRTVTVYWWGGVDDCYGLKEVRVERNADGQLVITVLEGSRVGDDVACIEIAVLKATTITLDEPLFVDAATQP